MAGARRIAPVAAGIAASVLAVVVLPVPFVWIFAGWAGFFFHVAMTRRRRALRLIGLNLALLLTVLAVAEVVFALDAREDEALVRLDRERKDTETRPADEAGEGRAGYTLPDDLLGYAPRPDNRVRRTRRHEEEIVYDIVYSIGADGLRKAPPHRKDADECILFFGGSFTFGEGVGDEQTLPWVVGRETGGRYRVYNFGFHGYGPHQMLAALESRMVDDVLSCRPRFVIYQMIRSHLKRAAGLARHDRHGPRYRLEPDGSVVSDGRFDDPPRRPEAAASLAGLALSRSYVLGELQRLRRYGGQIDLAAGIVDRARRTIESRWPGSEFHVIFWNERYQPKSRWIEGRLRGRGLRVHRIDEIIPDFEDDKRRYRIHEEERHPNALAYERIAGYVVAEIVDG